MVSSAETASLERKCSESENPLAITAMAEVLKEEGNRLMTENKPMEAIAKLVRARGNQALCERRGIHLPLSARSLVSVFFMF